QVSRATAKWTVDATVTPDVGSPNREKVDANSESLMTVKSDSPVYSANSKRSKVLRSLRRGEKVPPDLEVIDSEGRWRLVRGSGRGRPGFVREEQIEAPPNSASAKRKPDGEQPKQQ